MSRLAMKKQTFRENKVAFRWARCNVGNIREPKIEGDLFPELVFHDAQARPLLTQRFLPDKSSMISCGWKASTAFIIGIIRYNKISEARGWCWD